MSKDDSIIILTDKYGKRDRTEEIEKISFNSKTGLWEIDFVRTQNTFHYKNEHVKIVKNCLKDKKSTTVFDYLLQMAQFSDIKNDEGQNLLVKNLEKSRFINEKSALATYLNPDKKVNLIPEKSKSLIFPFGCNSSQYKAVRTAMNNQISIIQGPPGTGKTQTILNIIANLLINDKTVLIVSNNNDATANVYEKLASEKYGLGFICATHGNRKNIESFLLNQNQLYPKILEKWKSYIKENPILLSEEIYRLEKYFDTIEKISNIKKELTSIETETKYFETQVSEIYDSSKLVNKSSVKLLFLLQKIQFIYKEKEKLSLFMKYRLRTK